MSNVPFHYLDVRAFCYATEDERRVEIALRSLLPPEREISRTVSAGHHGDRILVMSARVERADDVRHVLERLAEMPEFGNVRSTLADRVDENCSFFLRVDKQHAFEGELALGSGIQIRGKVEAYPASREAAIENLGSYFEATG